MLAIFLILLVVMGIMLTQKESFTPCTCTGMCTASPVPAAQIYTNPLQHQKIVDMRGQPRQELNKQWW